MEFDVPKQWNEVTVGDFVELRHIESDNSDSVILKNTTILAFLADIEEELLENYYVEDVSDAINDIKFLKTQPTLDFVKDIGLYRFKGLDELTLGEYIDLDSYISDDYYKNLPNIAATLYRKHRVGEWGEFIWEPYGAVDISDRSKDFISLPITSIFGIINEFISWRGNFLKIYASIFTPQIDDPDSDEELSPEDLEDDKKQKELERFSWQFLVDNLTDGDVARISEVTDLPIIQVFNHISMKKVKPK